jgi:hypothetical protein
MATIFASNGFLRIGASVVTKALDLKISIQSNGEWTNTLTGDAGPSFGHKMAKVSCKNAVARSSSERKRIIRAFENDQVFTVVYRSGDMDYSIEGIIQSVELASSVNKRDEFDFEIEGSPSPIQDV